MTDFTPWLYAHYIKPYLDQCPRTSYEVALDLPNELIPEENRAFERALEFYATRSFLLGMKTGAGLRDAGV